MPARSVPQLLQHILGVDIKQRGAMGMQADVGMRAGNFEQILVCVNGVRINDPQTGHHNMDLPLTLMDIERIEILPGHGSSLYGSGAFGGTINIVTKTPKGKELEIESSGGGFGLNSQALSVTQPLGTFNNRFSFARKESSGYRPDTDFEITTLSFNSQRDFAFGNLEFLFGYADKDFGAGGFYSNLTSQETENTETRFINVRGEIEMGPLRVKPLFYYRRRWNKFKYKYGSSWYTNYHTTYSYGGEIQTGFDLPFAKISLGGEIGEEEVDSTNLGGHSRLKEALSLEFAPKLFKKIIISLGLRGDHYQTWGWQASPSVSLGYKINPQLRLKSSFGRSFRIPSFTELYYQSSANIGNEDLTPEKAWSYETGLGFSKGSFNAELSYFQRWADDLIDWLRRSSGEAWRAQNISQVDTQGIELELTLKPQDKSTTFSEICAGYIYQYSESEEISLDTKYTLDFLKHHARIGLNLSLPWKLAQNLTLSYKEKMHQNSYFLLDSRMSKKFEKNEIDYEIFLDITNLLNTSYSEQGNVRMPGRWVIGGMRIKL